jgi:transcriptional repressor NrdR
VVIKKDLAREPYDRSKIERGLFRSCTKLPISVDQINQIVDSVETEIFNLEKKEVPSQYIGEVVMERLKELDPVAYVRFASIYREFKDVNTFMDEIKKILDNQ